MTDKELIQLLRTCITSDCRYCDLFRQCVGFNGLLTASADRLEALLAENEHLREATKMMPRWVSVEEKLPHFNQPYIVTACDEHAPAGEGIWYSTVVVVAEYYNGCWTWYEGDTEYDLTGLVTHWQPFPKAPSTEDSPTGQKG